MQEESKVQPEVTQDAAPAANGAQQQQPDLNIQDLAALRSIIDVASTRGAFRAAEMEAVGKVFNKLSSFLDMIAAKEQSKEQ